MSLFILTEPCIQTVEKYSWSSFNDTQRSRLVLFLASKQLGLDIAAADIRSGYCSEHSLVWGGGFLPPRILGECSTVHSLPAVFLVFFKRRLATL